MNFTTFMARRYLASKNKPFFTSFLLFISLLGVSAGVFALLFVMAVMNGFESDFQRRILGFKAPIVLEPKEGDLPGEMEIRAVDPRIRSVVPFIEGEAVAQSESGGAMGVRVRGVMAPPSQERVGRLYQSGDFTETSVILGDGLASDLKVYPDFFDKIRLIFPVGEVGPTGDLLPRVRSLTLIGLFRSGYYEYDTKYAMISYGEARKLFGTEGRVGTEVWVESLSAVTSVRNQLTEKFGERVKVLTWEDQSPKLFAAMKLERIGMFLLLASLLLIASFNIFGLTSLTVMDKMRDMAVLRSLGLSARSVRRIYLKLAGTIGVLGAFVGGMIGILVISLLKNHPIRLPTTYYVEYLPILPDWGEVSLTLLLAPGLTILAALYPALQSTKSSPVDILKYE